MDSRIEDITQFRLDKLCESLERSENEQKKILVVIPENFQVKVDHRQVMRIKISELEDLVGDATLHESFYSALVVNSLFTINDYKAMLISLHKLLQPGGSLISFDFYLDIPQESHGKVESQFKPEEMFLKNSFGYIRTSSNQIINIQAKLAKYSFGEINFETLDFDLDDPGLRIIFVESSCRKIENNGSLMEPRIRDADGFRSRAGAIIFRGSKDSLQLLLLKRRSQGWTFPGGGVERGESFDEAVLRESFEESGAVCKIFKAFRVVRNEKNKTLTKVYLLECVEEQEEYPENNRQKSWVAFDLLKKEHEQLQENDFFGPGSNTTKMMLAEVWDSLKEINEK